MKRREQKRGREENCQKAAAAGGSRSSAEPKAGSVEVGSFDAKSGSFDAKSGSFDAKSGSFDARSETFEGQTTNPGRPESSSSRVLESGTGGAKIIKTEASPAKNIGEAQGRVFLNDLSIFDNLHRREKIHYFSLA